MTSQEFNTIDKKVDRILDHIETQHAINLRTAERLAVVETTQKEQRNTAAKWASAIGAVVAAVISGLAAAWRQ